MLPTPCGLPPRLGGGLGQLSSFYRHECRGSLEDESLPQVAQSDGEAHGAQVEVPGRVCIKLMAEEKALWGGAVRQPSCARRRWELPVPPCLFPCL